MKVYFTRLTKTAKIPTRAKDGDAGYDVSSDEEAFQLEPLERKLVSTGLKMAFPANYKCEVCPRSGLAAKQGVTVLNTPGTIDSGYRGECKVILINLSHETVTINKGDRIAQFIWVPVMHMPFMEVEEKDLGITDRGEGGCGSSGK
jgi:dUTP pyrophosphatase